MIYDTWPARDSGATLFDITGPDRYRGDSWEMLKFYIVIRNKDDLWGTRNFNIWDDVNK